MPKKGKKAGGGGGKKGEGRSLNVQQKAGTWDTARKEALLKEVRQRAQAEQERARLKDKIMKDKLQKGEKNSAKNLLKINEAWVRILEQAQSAEQKEGIAVMKATFEREVEELDSIIKDLAHRCQEQERRSAQLQHNHQQHVERLCDLHEKRLMLEHQQWGSCMPYFYRTQKMGHSKTQLKAELDDALLAIREEQKKETDEMHNEYHKTLEYFKEINLQFGKLNERKLEDRKKHQKTSNLQKMEQQKAPSNPIGQRVDMKTEQKLKRAVSQMKDMLILERSEQEKHEQKLIAASDQVHSDTLKLRDQLSQNRTAARQKLTDLSVHSDTTSKKLKALIAKGERIVEKGDICEKLESKVMSLVPPEIAALDADTEKAAGEFPELQNVMRRINTATLLGDTLKKHRQDLIRENQELEGLLHQQRDGNSPQLVLAIGPTPTSQARGNIQTGHIVCQGVHLMRPGK